MLSWFKNLFGKTESKSIHRQIDKALIDWNVQGASAEVAEIWLMNELCFSCQEPLICDKDNCSCEYLTKSLGTLIADQRVKASRQAYQNVIDDIRKHAIYTNINYDNSIQDTIAAIEARMNRQ